jgi:hypothetical protein
MQYDMMSLDMLSDVAGLPRDHAKWRKGDSSTIGSVMTICVLDLTLKRGQVRHTSHIFEIVSFLTMIIHILRLHFAFGSQ